jgi:hypothetical protein
VHEQELQKLFGALRSAGVEPIPIKGWVVARLYPEPGPRPYGDFDIVVRPEQYAAAVTVLNEGKSDECPVDLHRSLGRMHEQSLDALYARSQIARLDKVDIRILAAEDHLVVLIRRFLRHNAWRPLWLCDIAAAIRCRFSGKPATDGICPSPRQWLSGGHSTRFQGSPFNWAWLCPMYQSGARN